jgi:hypothetical protein
MICDQIDEIDELLKASLNDPTTWKASFLDTVKAKSAAAKKKVTESATNLGSKLNLTQSTSGTKPRGDYSPASFDPPVDVYVPTEFYTDTAYVTFRKIQHARLAARQMLGMKKFIIFLLCRSKAAMDYQSRSSSDCHTLVKSR